MTRTTAPDPREAPTIRLPWMLWDEAIAAADTPLLTVPGQLGVDDNAHVIESVPTHLAPELGRR